MKRLIALAIFLQTLFALARIDTLDVTSGTIPYEPAKVVGIRVLSSVASGTAEVKSVSTLHTVEDVAHVTSATNVTYTYIFTNGTETVTNTVGFHPPEIGPSVTSFVTNTLVTYTTNWIPTATSTLVVTNSIGGAITCSGGYGFDSPTNTFLIPGEPIFVSGTARGRVLLILER